MATLIFRHDRALDATSRARCAGRRASAATSSLSTNTSRASPGPRWAWFAGAGTVDAIVMASAATRGDSLYTSDVEDMATLRDRVPVFGAVQVVRV